MQYMNYRHKDTMYDYTYALSRSYDKLPVEWINYFVIRLSNLISYNMNWKNVYELTYIPEPEQLIVQGFPPVELRHDLNNWDTVFISDVIEHHHNDGKLDEYIDVNLPQLDYVVHKLNYKQAVCYMRGKDISSIIFYKDWHDEEKPCAYIEFIQSTEDINNLYTENETNCNILTPEEYLQDEQNQCHCNKRNCPHRSNNP